MNISFAPTIKGLIFDFDGTLANSMPIHCVAWKKTMLNYNITITDEELETCRGHTSKEIAEAFITRYELQANADDISQQKGIQYIALLPKVALIPQTYNILMESREEYKIAIGTNEEYSVFRHVSEHFHLPDISNAVVSWNTSLKPKPHPDIFLECATLLALEPQQCHVFEDSSHGIEAAKNAGMTYTHIDDIIK